MSPRELFGDGAFYILWFIFLFNGQGVNFISSLYKVGLPFLHYTKLVYHFFTVQGGYTISSLYKGGYTISSLYKVSIPFLHNTRQVYHFPQYKVVIPLLHSINILPRNLPSLAFVFSLHLITECFKNI